MESRRAERKRERRDRDIDARAGTWFARVVLRRGPGQHLRLPRELAPYLGELVVKWVPKLVPRLVPRLVQRLLSLISARMADDRVVPTSIAAACGLVGMFSGCLLYTGPINRPPVVTIRPPGMVERGKPAIFTAERSDPDQDGRLLRLEWAAKEGECPTDAVIFPDDPAAAASTNEFEVPGDVTDAGHFCVWARVTDNLGASNVAMHSAFGPALPNRSPMAKLELLSPPAGPPYPLYSRFRVSATGSRDPDDDVLGYRFEWQQRPSSSAAALESCGLTKISAAMSDICFTADVAGTYGVVVTVSDGISAPSTAEIAVLVAEDRPPCIVATDPPFGVPVVVRDPTVQQSFEVKVVSDDGDPFPPIAGSGAAQFSWFYGPEEGKLIALDRNAPLMTLPADGFTSGSRVVIRVEVRDRKTSLLSEPFFSCGDKAPRCATPVGSTCFQRVSWTVEYH